MTFEAGSVSDGSVNEQLAHRARVTIPFFTRESGKIAKLCEAMASRFESGGRLIAIGSSAQARSDARHIAVEFVHPVIVGKRALPALAICGEYTEVQASLGLLARPNDIVFEIDAAAAAATAAAATPADSTAGASPPAVAPDATAGETVPDVPRTALAHARALGCLTVAFSDAEAEWTFCSPTADAFIWQEITELLYHIVWELVHVYLDHGAVSQQNTALASEPATPPAANFLYPFLTRQQQDVSAVHADVQRSVVAKATESASLSAELIGALGSSNRNVLLAAAETITLALKQGATIFTLGNGGSATDAGDAAADYMQPTAPWQPRAAIDLTDNSAIITALTNDVGADVVFSRQIIAYSRKGDVVLAFSTSGNSRNVIQALYEARRRQLHTVAFVGYGGGNILHERLADHVIATPSQYVPRIQEAHAAAHHVLRALVQ